MPKKILVVDEDRPCVRLIATHLQRVGHEVVEAFDGRTALELIETEQPDLLILEIRMARADGWEIIERLKSNPATDELPIIVVSILRQDHELFRGYQAGVDVYLTKPFSPFEVLTFVGRIFNAQNYPWRDRW